MKVSTKLAVLLVAAASSVVGLASGALAQVAPSSQGGVTGGETSVDIQTAPNAAAAVTFKVEGENATGAAAAAIGRQNAAAAATTVTSNDGTDENGATIPGGTVNTATALGSNENIIVTVGSTNSNGNTTEAIELSNEQLLP